MSVDVTTTELQHRLRALDRGFGDWCAEQFLPVDADEDTRQTAAKLAAAVSFALHLKHTCMDLDRVAELGEPELDELLEDVNAEAVSGLPETLVSLAPASAPLVRSSCGRRVWMQKYRGFELEVAGHIRAMAADSSAFAFDEAALEQCFAGATDPEDHKNAVRQACTKRLSIITGGPGTGKTWTVARLIKVLLDSNTDRALRIEMAAPTGKAAYRVKESLDREVEALGIAEAHRPHKARTLHSLLGFRWGGAKPTRDAHNRLDLDVLIIDEASMVDLPMIARVLEALPEHASLVLLGDKDQLSSVEAGSVLAELCDTASPLYGGKTAPVAVLGRNFRYEKAPGIGAWAKSINKGDFNGLEDNAHVSWDRPKPDKAWAPAWLERAGEHFRAIRRGIGQAGQTPHGLLDLQKRFQVLCALRQGPYGVGGINTLIARSLGLSVDQWAAGVPVMVTSNDHERGVFNGDVGLVLPVRADGNGWVLDAAGELMACFPATGDASALKVISRAQMPPFEPCYAMTVHKSQGSEYTQVQLVLPADDAQRPVNQLISRELVYTGVTRARERVFVSAGRKTLENAVRTTTVRMSGLSSN